MAAAIAAAREGADVTIYERNDRLGKKILATGNGKCNLGNMQLSVQSYECNEKERLAHWLNQFGAEDTVGFFEGLGLMVKEKNGYLYPVSEQASSVLDVLRIAVEQLGVKVVYEAKIDRVSPLKTGAFEIAWKDRCAVHTCVILACGSKAAPKTGSDGSGYQIAAKLGLRLTTIVPALVQLKCAESACKSIAGVRADALVHIWNGKEKIISERGELQLTEYGISGIPVFQLSGLVNRMMEEGNRQLRAEIDFLPEISEDAWKAFAKERIAWLDKISVKGNDSNALKLSVEAFFTGMLNKKLMLLFIKMAGRKPGDIVNSVPREKLMEVFWLCKHFTLHITGSNSFDSAQICAGGVRLREVTDELEAVRIPGLYLAGELLDVDGRCGGYNLQWAWTSGYIAGKAAVKPHNSSKKKVVIVRGKADK